MNAETKKLIEGLPTHNWTPNGMQMDTSVVGEYVWTSDLADIVEDLTKKLRLQTLRKLEWERRYWEAFDKLVDNKIIELPIKTDFKT